MSERNTHTRTLKVLRKEIHLSKSITDCRNVSLVSLECVGSVQNLLKKLIVVDRVMSAPPKTANVLIPRTCGYVMLHDREQRRKVAEGIKLVISYQHGEIILYHPGGIYLHGVLKWGRRRQRGQEEKDDIMKKT